MRRTAPMIFAAGALAIALSACSKPEDIVLGPEPLKQLADQGDQFRKMSEEDRQLLVGYLTLAQVGRALGGDVKSTTGRTVGEVMVDARAWRESARKAQEEQAKRDAEAQALRDKVLAERKEIAEKIASAATLAVVGTRVLEEDLRAGRYQRMLVLDFAVENRSAKTIRQLKGRVYFKDATGDEVGSLNVDIDQPIAAGKTLKTDTGSGWKTNRFMNGNIEKIAGRDFSSMTTSFEPESIAFEGGEVIKAPALK